MATAGKSIIWKHTKGDMKPLTLKIMETKLNLPNKFSGLAFLALGGNGLSSSLLIDVGESRIHGVAAEKN